MHFQRAQSDRERKTPRNFATRPFSRFGGAVFSNEFSLRQFPGDIFIPCCIRALERAGRLFRKSLFTALIRLRPHFQVSICFFSFVRQERHFFPSRDWRDSALHVLHTLFLCCRSKVRGFLCVTFDFCGMRSLRKTKEDVLA